MRGRWGDRALGVGRGGVTGRGIPGGVGRRVGHVDEGWRHLAGGGGPEPHPFTTRANSGATVEPGGAVDILGARSGGAPVAAGAGGEADGAEGGGQEQTTMAGEGLVGAAVPRMMLLRLAHRPTQASAPGEPHWLATAAHP